MKFYCFYLTGIKRDYIKRYKGITADSINGFTFYDNNKKAISLYAFTDKKKIRDTFISTRDMDLFYYKTITIDDEDEINKFIDENANYILEFREVTTKIIDKFEIYRDARTDVLCTNLEYDNITIDREENFVELSGDLLNKLIYDDICNVLILHSLQEKLHICLFDVLELDNLIPQVYPYEDYPPGTYVNIDELNLFIRLFGNTLKK